VFVARVTDSQCVCVCVCVCVCISRGERRSVCNAHVFICNMFYILMRLVSVFVCVFFWVGFFGIPLCVCVCVVFALAMQHGKLLDTNRHMLHNASHWRGRELYLSSILTHKHTHTRLAWLLFDVILLTICGWALSFLLGRA